MILVTGGAGFIGSHLVEQLLKEDAVVVWDISRRELFNNDEVTVVNKDIHSATSKDMRGFDAVFHLAADPDVRSSVDDPAKSFDVNVVGSFKVLDAARDAGVERFVFASSGGTVYGDVPRVVTEREPLHPISPYGASKAAFEMYLSAYSSSYGINCSAMRLANVIGPRSRHGVIWDFFWKLRKNPKRLEVLGDGQQRKSFVHVSDVVSAFLLVFRKNKGFESYNVANDGTLSIAEVAELVSGELGVSPELSFEKGDRGWVGDVREIALDSSKLKHLGWKINFSQEEAVKDYVRWLKSLE